MRDTFTRFLARSLTLVEDELPSIYSEIARRVGAREVACEIDGDRIGIFGDGRRLALSRRRVAPAVRIVTNRATILDLIDARLGLDEAVWSERIVLAGSLDDLVAFHDGLMAYLHAAVRCPSFPELLDEYLASAPTSAGTASGVVVPASPESLERGAA